MGLEFASHFASAAGRLRGVSGRRRVAFGVHALLAAGAATALVAGLVASRMPNLALLVPLAVAGVIAESREVRLINGIGVDASTIVALVALVAWGPLPAYCLLLVAMLGGSLAIGISAESVPLRARIRAIRSDFWRIGNLANAGSSGWSLLAGGAVLSLAAPRFGAADSSALELAGAVLLAGCTASAVQLVVGPMVHWPLWYGKRLGETLAAVRAAVLVELTMVLLGTATAVLLRYAGTAALTILAPVVLLPLFIRDPARARSASELSHASATRLYAEALAVVVDLPRSLRRSIPNVLRLLDELRSSGLLAEVEGPHMLDAPTLKLVTRSDECLHAAWTVNEHWDGTGPAGLAGEDLPQLARILAVAEEWANWTAAGGPELSHADALVRMEPLGGRRLDPEMLSSVQHVIERERRVTPQDACQPRLHRRRERLRLCLPYAVARAALC